MNLKKKISGKNQNKTMKDVLAELKYIKSQLARLLLLIPQESLDDYRNVGEIKKDYLNSLNELPPV